jgi:osmoprotectant transport system substrate-binding protein
VTLAATALLAAGCGGLSGSGQPQAQGGSLAASGINLAGQTYTVGGKEFDEQLVLCKMTIQALQSVGATVNDRCNITGTASTRAALVGGQIDMYWEYTGTGWVNYLHQTKRITDPAALFQQVAAKDLAKNKVKWIDPAPFNDTYAIIVKSATADKLGVHTLSDYADLVKSDPSKATTCLASEFESRPDGWPGVEKAYGFTLPSDQVVTIAEGSIFGAVGKGSPCTFGEADASTDGRIVSLDLTLLKDDKHFFPLYNPALNVRQSVYQKYPQLKQLFQQVSDKLTQDAILQMNTDVDVKGQQAKTAAKNWATKAGLLG